MKNRDRLELKIHDLKIEMNKMLDTEESKRGENFHTELSASGVRLEQCSAELRSAILLDATEDPERTVETPDAEAKEKLALLAKANVGRVVRCALTGSMPDGPEREVQAAFGVGADHLPWELLQHHADLGKTTNGERVIKNTATAPTDGDVSTRPTIQSIVPGSTAEFLNVSSPVQAEGDMLVPILTTGAAVAPVAKNVDSAESSPVYGLETLQAGRLGTFLRYALEDEIRFPAIGSDLSRALLNALSKRLDSEILNRANGLLGDGIVANEPGDPADEIDYDGYVSTNLYGQVDGEFANSAREIRLLVNALTYASLYSKRVAMTERTAGETWTAQAGGLRVGAQIPATSNANIAKAVLARGSAPRALAPRFGSGVQILRDNLSAAKAGQMVLTLNFFSSFAVVEAGAYEYLKFKLS